MADKARYPQIPSTVWWGVRSILQRTPNATIDERLLGVQLGVQDTAAKAYVTELRSVGLLTDEGKASPLAQRWRLDETYAEAAEQIVEITYPEGLRHVSPPGEGDRQKAVNWFLREGFGQGAAGNKAATYLLLGSASPNEAPARNSARPSKTEGQPKAAKPIPAQTKTVRNSPTKTADSNGQRAATRGAMETMPLNVNVQIHIGADAGSDQIEAIFSAMRRYLHDTPTT